jgi:hypothetical protein
MTLSTRAASERGLLAVFCYSNYASGEMAPTSGTNTTFGGPLAMSRINLAKIVGTSVGPDRHHDRVSARSKSRTRRPAARLTVSGNHRFERMGWRLRQLPPKWRPRARTARPEPNNNNRH